MFPTLKTLIMHPEQRAGGEDPNPIILDQKRLAASVGVVALSLSPILYIGAWIEPLCVQNSISHYYFLPFLGSIFVGMLGFIGIFMFSYQGHNRWDRIMAKLGGAMAMLVAIFPTSGDGCAKTDFLGRAFIDHGEPASASTHVIDRVDIALPGLTLGSDHIHLGAAVMLFLILSWFALVSFRRDNGEGVTPCATSHGMIHEKSPQKTWRNRIYAVCAVVIWICLVVLYKLPDTSDGYSGALPPFFLAEAVALSAFGLSWFVKGRMIGFLNDPPAPCAADGTAPR